MINYCSQCGKKLIFKQIGDEGQQKYCSFCDKFYFNNPRSVVLVTIINEKKQVLLLRQKYISEKKWVLCSGYVKQGDTLEETVKREVLEETGQIVESCEYVESYYFTSKDLIMCGFIAHVCEAPFAVSKEVDDLSWFDLGVASEFVERENNFSGIHLDACIKKIIETYALEFAE